MADEFNQDEAAAQGENPEAAASANSADASQAASENETNAPQDPIDAELADLVDATGPISKEAELLADLQRLQAEFVNYKARVERDRDVSRNAAIAEVLRSLLPALDDLSRAEAHGDLEGSPFAAVVAKLRASGEKFGLKTFGVKGDKFDPEIHEALVQTPSADVTENTVADVVEAGYLVGDRLLRAAKVAVFIPAEG
ncbi:MAG: nucleotide exchange factor GrpE [Microbacteriaceae bacterium]|nr:nucleotide exchange factor GrpE [Microbacteriaceae bacterium]